MSHTQIEDICVNCHRHPASCDWVGDSTVFAHVHGMSVRWCEQCAVGAQLAHARKCAASIPGLERKLAAFLERKQAASKEPTP